MHFFLFPLENDTTTQFSYEKGIKENVVENISKKYYKDVYLIKGV